MASQGPVLVAVDGVAAWRDAVAWAAAEASARQTGLVLLHVIHWPPPSWDPLLAAHVRLDGTRVEDTARRLLQEAAELARRVVPGLTVSDRLGAGAPVGVIAREGARAALIVLGRTPHRRSHLPWRRSLTAQVIARATCPVALVGFGHPVPAGPSAGRVVIAVDGEHGAVAAVLLQHAFEAADRRGVGVTILSSDEHPVDTIVRWHQLHYPSVDVRRRPQVGTSPAHLHAESSSAALLVLGATSRMDVACHAIPAPTIIVTARSRPGLRKRWCL